MAEEPEKVTAKQLSGQAEGGYPKIIKTDNDGIVYAQEGG